MKAAVYNLTGRRQPYSSTIDRIVKQVSEEWSAQDDWGTIRVEHHSPSGEHLEPKDLENKLSRKIEKAVGHKAPVRVIVHHRLDCAEQLPDTSRCICKDPRVSLVRPPRV